MMKILKTIKTNKLFWEEISNNTELLGFFSKNSFSLDETKSNDIFGLLTFYRIGIIDNSLDLYADIDEVKDKVVNNYQEALSKLVAGKSDFDIENYFDLNVEVEKYTLLDFNDKIATLNNGTILDKSKIIESIKTNVINAPEVKNVVVKDSIFVYNVQFNYSKLSNLVDARKKSIKILYWFSGFMLSMFVLLIILSNV